MKKTFLKILAIAVGLYVLLCILLYFNQDQLIFFPQKLDKDYQFKFDPKFEEMNVKTADGILLNGLLFKADSAKGLIFYLHGNAGSLKTWGEVAKTYTDFNYDVFMLDYRGYGKSEGLVKNPDQLFNDMQTAYDELKKKYNEANIVVLGYSFGTGPAAKLASTNNPRLLILQAPYYSMTDMMKHRYRIFPTFILKYKIDTKDYVKDCKMPIVDFHGNNDGVIYYGSSLKLKEYFKRGDTLITLNNQGHNGITDNPEYRIEIKRILNQEK